MFQSDPGVLVGSGCVLAFKFSFKVLRLDSGFFLQSDAGNIYPNPVALAGFRSNFGFILFRSYFS